MTTRNLVADLFTYVKQTHPRSLTGLEEARAVSPERFADAAERYLTWGCRAYGGEALTKLVDAYVHFAAEVNLAQGRYEAAGHYAFSSFQDAYDQLYSQTKRMDDYLWGAYVTNLLWVHHLEVLFFFEDRFLSRLDPDAHIVELASGHGGWGVWALDQLPAASLRAFDISPSSIRIAQSIAEAAGVADRVSYEERNALALPEGADPPADACICCLLAEHLEDPGRLFTVLHDLLKPGGFAFVTAALTAAQDDHICEFRRESEVLLLAETAGFRVLELQSTCPKRTLPNNSSRNDLCARDTPSSSCAWMGRAVLQRSASNRAANAASVAARSAASSSGIGFVPATIPATSPTAVAAAGITRASRPSTSA